MSETQDERSKNSKDARFTAPAVSPPKGGGAIQGIGEKFGTNPVTGTGSLSIPLPLSSGRSGFTPALALAYDSGSGNGPYGFGWTVGYPHITRRTDRGIPQYFDDSESDVFILSGAEDLVPVPFGDGRPFHDRDGYRVTRYQPRIEGLFARIERWRKLDDPSDTFWRSISRENVTTVYGKTASSRVADPENPRRIFSWLVCESRDDRGNAAVYDYVAEDGRGKGLSRASEANRTETARSANRYLKRVRYGNRQSTLQEADLSQNEWLFELVLDYGDHAGDNPSTEPTRSWDVRPDVFSTHRAGFEVRTYRRCQRFLMFHRFEELGPAPKLVRSLSLDYDDFAYPLGADAASELQHPGSTGLGSFLRKAIVTGYAESGFARSMPALELSYSRPQIGKAVRTLDDLSGANLPSGVDGDRFQWVDLDGEGLSGVLSEQGGAWWYKRNLGLGRLGAQELVAAIPSSGLGNGAPLLDLAGDGQLDLVQLAPPAAGFFERDSAQGWRPFRSFASQANLAWDDANLRFADLTGDGHADVLTTEEDRLCWHPSLGEEGFGARRFSPPAFDEDSGPKLVFADATGTVFMADMSGDGLPDLVRIRNGEVCYWPNLGYGRFGRKVTMDDAPLFDAPDQFEPRRLRLADIDGSGVVDILYFARDGVRLFFNRSGNGWTPAYRLENFPLLDSVASVAVTDVLGTGTACLVWSTSLPGQGSAPLRFIELMEDQKPHLLIAVENNLGARTSIEYSTSTRFYLEDQQAGRPWVTRLPFPVHVVERVETLDAISGNRFVTRYAYHHGHYDGVEREFRGFGLVEQRDTEEFSTLDAAQRLSPATNVDAASHVPPVLTRSWFHTGLHLRWEHVSDFFAGLLDGNNEAPQRQIGLTIDDVPWPLPDDTAWPEGLSAEEAREASRALRGSLLRQAVYALDGSPRERYPYSVAAQSFSVRRLQARGSNSHAVFLPHLREAITHHYERAPEDPRISHEFTLEVDEFGNVTKSATVAYDRSPVHAVRADQKKLHIVYSENDLTNSIDEEDRYRTPLPAEARSYHLTGLLHSESPHPRFTPAELLSAAQAAALIPYEQSAASDEHTLEKRLIERVRTLYRRDDLSAPLPFRQLQSRALPFETYKLVFTPGLLAVVYGDKLENDMLVGDGGFVHVEEPGAQKQDDQWWIRSGRVFFSEDRSADGQTELAAAEASFFLPRRYEDAFGSSSFVGYDRHVLLIAETRDAVGNTVTVGERSMDDLPAIGGIDYRVLQPRLVTDPNGNRTAVAYDALGLVVGTALMGKRKGDDPNFEGDILGEDFLADLPDVVITAHLDRPLDDPHAILARASTRLIYDLFAYERTRNAPNPAPAVVHTIARETHVADLRPGEQARLQLAFSYSDGFGREIQKKARVEPGPLPQRDPATGSILVVDGQPVLTEQPVEPRWVGSGWTVFNNKGKPVRQFEPFFSDRHGFDADVRIGFSRILLYDPVERVIATLHPNQSWEKVVFDAWRQESWDVNDTALIADPRLDSDVGDFFRRLEERDFPQTWYDQRAGGALGREEQAAARKTELHAATPLVAHVDPLGRTFLSIAHNRFRRAGAQGPGTDEFYETRVVFDIEGNQRAVIDARGRVVMRYDYDLLGQRVHQASMEAGERWTLANVAGNPVYGWDSRGHRIRTEYDDLQRPVQSFVRGADRAAPAREILFARTEYGEGQTDDLDRNLRTRPARQFDTAGLVTFQRYDFKGNALHVERVLAEDYKAPINWVHTPAPPGPAFATRTTYDALNRPTSITTPDKSVYLPRFNHASLLEAVQVQLRGDEQPTSFVTNIDYDAKGQRLGIVYATTPGNEGVTTSYEYDCFTFRLRRLTTTRASDRACLQDIRYVYDPVGNITHTRDDAQPTIYFNGEVVRPDNDYRYDALYRLIRARGREHFGQVGQPQTSPDDAGRVRLPHPNDGQAMRSYSERYDYDPVGNILALQHRAARGCWTRAYDYEEEIQLERDGKSNRLSRTWIEGRDPITEAYAHDVAGNMSQMPHLSLMRWDFRDQLSASARQVVNAGAPETTYYVYDGAGQRVRKVTERQNGTRKNERIYFGGFEVFREYGADGGEVVLERETLHVMDDKQRVALVETRTIGDEDAPARLVRYQLGNHLGSASLELDEQGRIISYEEYYPYGSTSYQAGRSDVEVSRKRYRYTGMERDEETGLSYHAARYYAPWLGRWTSTEPEIDRAPAQSSYSYSDGSPTVFSDCSGRAPDEADFHKSFEEWQAKVDRLLKRPEFTALDSTLQAVEEGIKTLEDELEDTQTRRAVLKAGEKFNRLGQEMVSLKYRLQLEQRLQRYLSKTISERNALEETGAQLLRKVAANPYREDNTAGLIRSGVERLKLRGAVRVNLMAGLTGVAAAGLLMAHSEAARDFAKASLVQGVAQGVAAKVVGPRLAFGVTMLLTLCGDQAGACEAQGIEEMINKRIEKEFPSTVSKYCLIGIGWPCTDPVPSGDPGYAEAREKVIEMLNREAAEDKAAEDQRLKEHQRQALKNFEMGRNAGGGTLRPL